MIRLYAIIASASLVMSGASFFLGKWKGYGYGVAHERSVQAASRARTQVELDRLGEKVAQQAGELLAIQRERMRHVVSLENDALNAVGADRSGISAIGGLLRLQQRWGQP